MSKIKELLNEKDSVLVFDVDGVLAIMEFGEHNHFLSDGEWNRSIDKKINYYTEDKVSHTMQKYLKNRDMDRIYIITKVYDENETNYKKLFCNTYYNIPVENVYSVKEECEKVFELMKIKDKYKDLEEEKIIMIDDTVNILNDVLEHTNCSTAHISSFLDIL